MSEQNLYNGCLRKSGQYLDLRGPMAVFFDRDWNASLSRSDDSVLAIFYRDPESLYTVLPFEPMTVFLPSGQPLGADRQYHLPRQSKICLASHPAEPAELL